MEFTSATRHNELQKPTFVIGAVFLEMENGGGMVTENFFTPESSGAARTFATSRRMRSNT